MADMSASRDLRFALRVLIRNPTFALAALTVMALGIGATTAVFTVVRGVLLRPLPYAHADRLVVIRADSSRGVQQTLLTPQEYLALRARPDIFEDLASYTGVDGNVTGVDDMEVLSAASI